MAQIQLKRGTAAAVTGYTGPAGEIVVNTDTWAPVLQDGVTAGGHLIQSLSFDAPTITSPANGIQVGVRPIVMSSPFTGDSFHVSTTWEFSTDSTFETIDYTLVRSVEYLTFIDLAALDVTLEDGTYYARVKYFGMGGMSSDWSATVSFIAQDIQWGAYVWEDSPLQNTPVQSLYGSPNVTEIIIPPDTPTTRYNGERRWINSGSGGYTEWSTWSPWNLTFYTEVSAIEYMNNVNNGYLDNLTTQATGAVVVPNGPTWLVNFQRRARTPIFYYTAQLQVSRVI